MSEELRSRVERLVSGLGLYWQQQLDERWGVVAENTKNSDTSSEHVAMHDIIQQLRYLMVGVNEQRDAVIQAAIDTINTLRDQVFAGTRKLHERSCELRAANKGIDRLRDEIERLQHRVRFTDAVIRSGDVAALTDAEREAIKEAARIIDAYEEEMDGFPSGAAARLRKLLERLG